MIIWVILFLLIIAISFVLAYRSMIDYQEIPQKTEEDYGLYLVRANPVTGGFLDSISPKLAAYNVVLSLERLFKGNKTTLCIFGPKNILGEYKTELDLLELEDYTNQTGSKNMDIWEVGIKDKEIILNSTDSIFKDLPKLYGEDQFFWQVVLGGKGVQIRAAISSESDERRKIFAGWFEGLSSQSLIKVPRPYSSEQMFNFYCMRSLGRDFKIPVPDSGVIMRLVKI